jgi:hypothetical protein
MLTDPRITAKHGAAAWRWIVSAEIRALLRAVPHEADRAALLARMEDGRATDADRALLAGSSLETLQAVVSVEAMT